MRRCAILAGLILAGCGSAEEAAPEAVKTAAATSSSCRETSFENTPLVHCVADPARHRIVTALGPSDAPFRSLAALAGGRPADASPVAFAVNGGMFDEAGLPIGYYVEDGKRLKELNRASGAGNFHLLPNGVFFGSSGAWQVRTAEDFYANVSDRPRFGTQSGPMLVIGGKLHPKIDDNGSSQNIRNGVGVDGSGRAHFVMSLKPISFGRLARYYRDELAVADALYLDGNVSVLWDPASGRLDYGAPIGPMIVVEEKE